MSHAGHKIVKCRDCGAVITQCRCIGPNKHVEWRDGPCPRCRNKAKEGDAMTPFMKMTNQPTWPNATAPERITSIKGGFVDGAGTKHATPPGVTEAHNINGVWYWKR